MNPTATTNSTHRMSDAELRKAIAVMQSRADDARRRGETEDADRMEATVNEFREEMATRL
ncbi:hypothetical protein R4172_04480 [Rhodococcus kroppenstedtii]|uniref:Uncharacterized protein n=1 Tax=Rhodococcoides kroppenstedtii TaxID=293050 RepID=A0A1I0U523_9NOCA|nr:MULTISPECIES: hypothetical protein [Rhodococcus]AMY19937.1 hypothetical protein A3Q40_02568 [Rhodococcus sp. PBTS 1]MBT1192815.1 hypothetical protein [Rhodococcus kroppenstedtii]MBY6314684.1 hypothetical protein [Rhodococcus kroppenstedtii]MBY6322491.1 hypothetical protein [Rhodococcus kroppenstedtii]MBY6401295.1 hypothetical protein [Rhodococcus kroppenstedtii]